MLKQQAFYEEAQSIIDIQLRKRVYIRDILYCVSQETGYSQAMIVGERRKSPLVMVRSAVCILARAAGYSFPQIGRALGGRDHATIIHCVRKYGKDPEVAAIVKNVAELLGLELKVEA